MSTDNLITTAWATGDPLLDEEMRKITKTTRGIAFEFEAGQDMSSLAGNPPAVYVGSDNKVYLTDASDLDKLCPFIGFLSPGQRASVGESVEVALEGAVVRGFTGLTSGRIYNLQDAAGTIGLGIGTYEKAAAKALTDKTIKVLSFSHGEYIGQEINTVLAAESAGSFNISKYCNRVDIQIGWHQNDCPDCNMYLYGSIHRKGAWDSSDHLIFYVWDGASPQNLVKFNFDDSNNQIDWVTTIAGAGNISASIQQFT